MARDLQNQTNVIAPTSDYPSGRIKDDTGSNDGTPVDESLYGDIHQFFAKILREANIEPNGLPDNVSNGFQLFNAFYDLAVRKPLAFNGIFNAQKSDLSLSISSNIIAVDDTHIYFFRTVGTTRRLFKRHRDTATETELVNLFLAQPKSVYVDDSYIYLIIDSQGLQVYDKSGTEQASKNISINQSLRGLWVYNGIIYIGSLTNEQVLRYDASNNNQLTSVGTGLTNIASVAVGYDRIFVSRSDSDGVSEYNIETLTQNFSVALTGSGQGSALDIYGGYLYTLHTNGTISKINFETRQNFGAMNFNTGSFNAGDMVINRNQMFVVDDTANKIYIHDQVWERWSTSAPMSW